MSISKEIHDAISMLYVAEYTVLMIALIGDDWNRIARFCELVLGFNVVALAGSIALEEACSVVRHGAAGADAVAGHLPGAVRGGDRAVQRLHDRRRGRNRDVGADHVAAVGLGFLFFFFSI